MLELRSITEKPIAEPFSYQQIYANVEPSSLPSNLTRVVYQVDPSDYELTLMARCFVEASASSQAARTSADSARRLNYFRTFLITMPNSTYE